MSMSKPTQITTLYAPAETATRERLTIQNNKYLINELLMQFSDSISHMLVVLNKQRQIIYANKRFCENLGFTEINDYLGVRPGNALNCSHATHSVGGCGTTEFCRTCGAVNAILESQKGSQSTKECRITTQNNDALDFRVTATPINIESEQFTIFDITDISHEKRRQSLERLFFHDVLNSAGGILGLSEVIGMIDEPDKIVEMANLIHGSTNNLINEIQSQRQLSAAEDGDLEVNIVSVDSGVLIKEVQELYENHKVTQDKHILIHKESEIFTFDTDIMLLRRILGNMTKNALEASMPESTVTLKAQKQGDRFIFSVHNQGYIERDIQLQMFKRSYTTKGIGRGLGTYSMKLFGEKYLNGEVWFESTREDGTTFFIKL